MSIIYAMFFADTIEFGPWMFFLPLVFSFTLIFLASCILKIFRRNYQGWKLWLKILCLLVFLMELTAYIESARARANFHENNCYKSLAPDGIYLAKLCSLGRDAGSNFTHMWLMMYDAKTLILLKEGDAGLNESNEIRWEIDKYGKTVSVNLKFFTAEFKLPPSWLDRLRAKLP
jgi:hypothetical protein